MAFNPFTTFRKNQKVWMAGAILICMVTFIFCGIMQSQGQRGGVEGWLMELFGRRGNEVATINGRSYHDQDFDEIKKQRMLASDYMRELLKIAAAELEGNVKKLSSVEKEKQDKQLMEQMFIINRCKTDLYEKLQRNPRYFRGGVSLDDMIEFVLWRDLAKQYSVEVSDAKLQEYLGNACHGRFWGYYQDPRIRATVNAQVKMNHHVSRDEVIRDALIEEFKVQIVQLALIENKALNAFDQWAPSGDTRQPVPIFFNLPLQQRIVPTPEQVYAEYLKTRTQATLDLVPVSLEVLAKQVKLPEDPAKRREVLKTFYDEYASKKFNPSSDSSGFTFQEKAQFQFLTADANMEYYQAPAKTISVLEKTPPIAFNPLSPLSAALGWASTPVAWKQGLYNELNRDQKKYEAQLGSSNRTLEREKALYLIEDDKQKAKHKPRIDALEHDPDRIYKNSASPLISPFYYSPGQFDLELANLAKLRPDPKEAANQIAAAAQVVLGGGNGALTAAAEVVGIQERAYQAQAEKLKVSYKDAQGNTKYYEVAKGKPLLMDAVDTVLVPLEKPAGTYGLIPRRVEFAGLLREQVPDFGSMAPFTAAALTYYGGAQPQYLPVAGFLEDELRTKSEQRLAQSWVNATMNDVKRRLEANSSEFYFPAQIEKLKSDYTRQVTDKDGTVRTIKGLYFGQSGLRNEYEVDSPRLEEFDPDLKMLRDAFENRKVLSEVNVMEGRGGKPDMLREGDFPKLLFGTERHGLGTLTDLRIIKVWPPYAKVLPSKQNPLVADKGAELKLFDDAEKPFVFWKSAKYLNQPLIPENKKWDQLDVGTLDLVEKQYRANEARTKLLPKVKELALSLFGPKVVGDPLSKPNLEKAARTLDPEKPDNPDTRIVQLAGVAKLVRNPKPGAGEAPYVEYSLPARKIPYPRTEMVQQLLSMRTLTEPIKVEDKDGKINYKDLNDLNAELFKLDSKHRVQVLTNKPRNTYYITVFMDEKSNLDFFKDMQDEFQPGVRQNTFFSQVQHDYGKELLRLAVKQMIDANVKLNAENAAAAQKRFKEEQQ